MGDASGLLDFLASGSPVTGHRPWPRFCLNMGQWRDLIAVLESREWSLLGLWAEPEEVHVALYDEARKELAVASLACLDGRFPSLSSVRPGAIRLERAIQDLTGLVAEGLEDTRPWLDHGQFSISHPLARGPAPAAPRPATGYAFLSAEGEGLHQIPVGPVHAGIIEPGHFRFHANGETVVRLEERLGYVHKGIEALMQGKTPAEAAKLAARVSGDSTVAYSIAFARAVEAALGIEAPPRAQGLRGLMAELERLANHFGDIGAICNDAAFVFMHSQCSILREKVLTASEACFSHRLMMDRVVPGGVAQDLSGESARRLRDLAGTLRRAFEPLVEMYDNTPSIIDRTYGTGIVTPDLARRFAAGGFVGRASGRAFDARRDLAYPPYDKLDFETSAMSARGFGCASRKRGPVLR